MSAIVKPLIQYLLYPLAIKFASWAYSSYIIKNTEDDLNLTREERKALMEAVSNAKTNEERKQLSSAISKFNRMSVHKH